MPLHLVHLSDIHFHGYGAGWDEDEDQRDELLKDLARVYGPDPNVDAILVGGDIAYSATAEEYTTAKSWIDNVCHVCHVDPSGVWVVPGNHDVSRGAIQRSVVARDFRNAIRGCALGAIDRELKNRLSVDPAGEGLMVPFANYNTFADHFGCGTTAREPHWFDGTLSCDGHRVRLTGINSALISDSTDDKRDEPTKLVAGCWQCTLPRTDGLIHIVVGHHPPEWLRDWANVAPYLARAHLVLFGHEHRFAAQQVTPGGTVHVFAGAVGPERLGGAATDEYLPSWAAIRLSCTGDSLNIEVDPHVWLRDGTRFGPHPDGVQSFVVQLEPSLATSSTAAPPAENEFNGMSASPLISPMVADLTGQEHPDSGQRRRLGVQFMTLPPSRRLDIARRLGVLDEPTDLALPPPRLYETLLTRIRERDLIDDLQKELNRA